uniref:Pre-mRNA cleavage complex 2 protein Pcf11 n=1 Tax=Knipowitschia caucasica TaxID=637954 RepID=A0AAV2J7W2_KNICA
MEDACREYESSLEDLTFNSKPHINMLTILAEENIAFAKEIVGIIEAQISKAPAIEKLPVLYLVDSIVKNVGRDYLPVFAKNLITSFICVFEKVDENTRKSLFKLRSTWDEVFPPKKLYALDVRVNSVDPAWPIKPLPPTASIHVNPKFLKQSDETPAVVAQPVVAPEPPVPPVPPVPVSSVTQEQLIRQQLLAKQKQLLELQQKKIELELEQTKAQLAGGFMLPTSTPSLPPKAIVPPATVIRPWKPPQSPAPEAKGPVSTSPVTAPPAPVGIRDPRLNRPVSKELLPSPSKSKSKAVRPDDAKPKPKAPSPMSKTVPGKTKSVEDKKDPRVKKRSPVEVEELRERRRAEVEEVRERKRIQAEVEEVRERKRIQAEVEEVRERKRIQAEVEEVRERKRIQAEVEEVRERKRAEVELRERRRAEVEELREKKRRCDDSKDLEEVKRRREEAQKGKLMVNGSMPSKEEFKTGGNARTHARKRSRSPDNTSPSHTSSRERDRRSPKRQSSSPPHKAQSRSPPLHKAQSRSPPPHKAQSRSPKRRSSSPPSHKPAKNQRARSREDHSLQGLKKTLSDGNRRKRPDDRDPPRGHDPKEAKDAQHRYRSWEETKHGKDEQQHKSPAQRHKPYTSPRTPKHRLSVDANLQIPDVLNSASKKDLLRRASRRLESGEITEEEFLNLAHKIKNLFQYQEEKQQRGVQSDRRSKEHEEPSRPMVEDYNHGREFPPLKALPGLRFKRRADPREAADREWISPLSERQRLDNEVKSGYDRRRPEPPQLASQEPPRFERERLSPLPPPLLPREQPESSPVARFESPNSEHSEDGEALLHQPPTAQSLQNMQPKSILKARPDGPGPRPQGFRDSGPRSYQEPHFNASDPHFDHMTHGGPMRGFDGPQPRPRFDAPMQRFEGPQRFMGPMGFQHRPPRYEGPFDGPGPRPGFDGPRFEPRFPQQQPMRPLGPMFDGPMGPQQGFNMGPNSMGPNSMGPNSMGPNSMGPNQMGPNQMGPNQMGPNQMGPNQMGPQHFPEPMGGSFPTGPMYQGPNFIQPGPFAQPQGGFYNQGPGSMGPQGPGMGPGPGMGLQQPMNMMNMNQNFIPQNTVPFPPAPLAPENHFGQVDVNDLLSKLVSNGIIKASQPEDRGPTSGAPALPPAVAPVVEEEEDEEEPSEDDLPDLTSFRLDPMKHRYDSVVTRLYTGNQCCLCSMRFTAAQTDLYADHLDWHFRQNHAGKQAARKVTYRRWYYGLTDWIEFEEIADLEERAKSQFFEKENEEEVQKTQAAAKEEEIQSVRATKDQVAELCEICQEPFETYWVEEEEDWFLRNALRVDEKNFHPACFEDYQKSSYLDVTPSPNKLLTEHPLSTLSTTNPLSLLSAEDIKVKTEDVGGSSCSVKKEVDSEIKQERVSVPVRTPLRCERVPEIHRHSPSPVSAPELRIPASRGAVTGASAVSRGASSANANEARANEAKANLRRTCGERAAGAADAVFALRAAAAPHGADGGGANSSDGSSVFSSSARFRRSSVSLNPSGQSQLLLPFPLNSERTEAKRHEDFSSALRGSLQRLSTSTASGVAGTHWSHGNTWRPLQDSGVTPNSSPSPTRRSFRPTLRGPTAPLKRKGGVESDAPPKKLFITGVSAEASESSSLSFSSPQH